MGVCVCVKVFVCGMCVDWIICTYTCTRNIYAIVSEGRMILKVNIYIYVCGVKGEAFE